MKTIPCPHCRGRLVGGLRFTADYLRAKGFAKDLFRIADNRGMKVVSARLCEGCSVKAQGHAIRGHKPHRVTPEPKPAPRAQQVVKPVELFLCGGCSKQKPVQGSQTLPRMTRRCTDCLPGAKRWWDSVYGPKPVSAPQTEAKVATAIAR
jgi:hypothetical protein